MMKYHPQITKTLKKTYSLLAAAAMRAMTPEYKWLLKKKLAPYNAARKAMGQKVSEYKASLGYMPRKGLAGRIDYWNGLQGLTIGSEGEWNALYGVDGDKIAAQHLNELDANSLYRAPDYATYKKLIQDKADEDRKSVV